MTKRIAHISVSYHCNDLGGRLWNPAICWTQKYAVFVELQTDDGFVGTGECWCFDRAPNSLIAFIETEVAPHIVGAEIDDLPAILQALLARATLTARHGILCSALSGIDIALWDIRAQRSAKPVWQMINPDGAGLARLYRSGGLYGKDKDRAALAVEMRSMTNSGFRMVKLKIGGLSIAEDIARVEAVLATVPAETRLIIDGVYSYSRDNALAIYKALPPDRIEAFQSPIAAADISGMAWLVAQDIPVMATEAEYRPEVHKMIIAEHAVRFLQVAPIACGGITRVRELSTALDGTSIQLSLEISSTAIALMAACHIAAADSRVAQVEYHSVHEVFFERLRLQREGQQDHFALPVEPGLGITLPSDAVKRTAGIAFSKQIPEPRNAVR